MVNQAVGMWVVDYIPDFEVYWIGLQGEEM